MTSGVQKTHPVNLNLGSAASWFPTLILVVRFYRWNTFCVGEKSVERVPRNLHFSYLSLYILPPAAFYLLPLLKLYMRIPCGVSWVLLTTWPCVIAAIGAGSRILEVTLGSITKWWGRLCWDEKKMRNSVWRYCSCQASSWSWRPQAGSPRLAPPGWCPHTGCPRLPQTGAPRLAPPDSLPQAPLGWPIIDCYYDYWLVADDNT